MAGAGEACSHIAAMMYAIVTAVRIELETALLQFGCQWLEPTNPGEVALVEDVVCTYVQMCGNKCGMYVSLFYVIHV